MSGNNKQVWEQEWSSEKMKTVPGHAANIPSDEIVLFRGYLIALGIKPPQKIIDIGSGKGRNSIYLAKEGFEVYGCEYIKSAIHYSQAQSRKEHVQNLTHFNLIDLSKPWKFKDGFFDIAIDSLTSVGLRKKDREFCLDEMYRTLKPTGIALIRVVSADDELEMELMKNNPGPEPNSSIWPDSGKFQKNFTKDEILKFYKQFEILALEKRTKPAFKVGKNFIATNWWIVLKK